MPTAPHLHLVTWLPWYRNRSFFSCSRTSRRAWASELRLKIRDLRIWIIFLCFCCFFFILFIWYLTWMDTQSRCSLRMSLTSWICPAHSFESWQSHYYHNPASEVPGHHGGLCWYCRSLVDHSSPPSPVWEKVRISFTWDTDSNKLEIMAQFSASLTWWGQNTMTASALPGPALLAAEAEVTANPVHVHLAQ